MRKYETILILHPALGKEDLEGTVKKYKELLESHGAVSPTVSHWGRKLLAFETKKQKHGQYFCYQYSSENSSLVDEMNAIMRIDEKVLKFQTHRVIETRRKFKGNPRHNEASAAAV